MMRISTRAIVIAMFALAPEQAWAQAAIVPVPGTTTTDIPFSSGGRRNRRNCMNPRTRLIALSLSALTFTSMFATEVAGKGKNVTVDKKDQNPTIACTGNAVTVTADDNQLTLTGECSKLTVKAKDINVTAATIKELVVSGTDVNVTVANVGKITVTGEDVNVVWGNGIGGKDPTISKKAKDINIVHAGK